MRRPALPRLAAFLLAIAAAAAPAAWAEDLAVRLGKQRATGASVEWEIREAGHPSLGAIRFAYVKRPLQTRVGDTTVHSRAYFSCQRDRRTFAIELSNALSPADPGGLPPASDPRLFCNRPLEDGKLAREEILASWTVSPTIGDAMTRGLRAFPLRECAWIDVAQQVQLPEGSGGKVARIEFELHPYSREIDAIFSTCGELSAYTPAPVSAPVAVAQAPAPVPAPAAEAGWREARVLASGRTNVRSGPDIKAPVVTELAPGSVVRVQSTGTEWWRARSHRGSTFEGFIRQDRLVFR